MKYSILQHLDFSLFFSSNTDFWVTLRMAMTDMVTKTFNKTPQKATVIFLFDIRQTSHMAPQSLFISVSDLRVILT